MMTSLRSKPCPTVRRTRLKKLLLNALRIAFVCLVMLIVILPFYVAVLYAFRKTGTIPANRLAWPSNPTLENFREVILSNDRFLIGYKNSILNTIPTILLLMFMTSIAAWVLARFNSRFYRVMYSILTLGLLIPFQCYELPLYLNWYNAGLVSSNLGFIIARTGLQISISLTAVTGFVKTVPRELEEAANIDGCPRFKTFWKIVFPLMTPINVTQLVLNTLFVWNDYSTSIILLRSKESQTLTLAQIVYFTENMSLLNQAFAFFILSMLPILILYLSLQKYIVSGITAGAVKG